MLQANKPGMVDRGDQHARGDANAFWNIVVLVTLTVRCHPISLGKNNNKPRRGCKVGF